MDHTKEDEQIILRDQYKIDDNHSKIRGIVFAYDENGKLLFTRENMIVKSGRAAIVSAISNGTALNLNNLTAIVGDSTAITTAGDTIADSFGTYTEIKAANITSAVEEVTAEYTIIVSGINSPQTISCLGLVNGTKLFSRVVFPSYPASTGTLTFTYYLYF